MNVFIGLNAIQTNGNVLIKIILHFFLHVLKHYSDGEK